MKTKQYAVVQNDGTILFRSPVLNRAIRNWNTLDEDGDCAVFRVTVKGGEVQINHDEPIRIKLKRPFEIPELPVAIDRYGDLLQTDHVLAFDSGRGFDYRFGVGVVPEGKSARQVTGGPLVDGPWAFTFGLASVVCANPEHGTYGETKRLKEAGKYHVVKQGDSVRLDGRLYTVRIERGQFLELDA